jgi:signal transduction histidine kinase
MRLRPEVGGRRFRPHLPRRTIRVRLALLIFAVFLASGAALLAVTVGLWLGTTKSLISVAHVPGSGAPSPPHGPVTPPGGVTQHGSDLHQLLIVSAIALAIMTVVSIALGLLVAGRFLRPLQSITKTTRDISASNLHERLNLAGPDDELKELGDTIDDLLGRLERSFQFERQFVANASHELRTPLATMRAALDVAMAKPGPVPPQTVTLSDRLRHELDQVDRLLDGFLNLAQTQQGPVADESTVSLGDIASAAIERRTDAISSMELQVEREECLRAWVRGSETLLSRMVENVIDNAVHHNEPGGWVRVKTALEGSLACLVVENGGPVLAQSEVEQLARPFRRLGAERTGSDGGSGLGLSIVKSIAESHGGTLALHARSNGGLRVVIVLPLAVQMAATRVQA